MQRIAMELSFRTIAKNLSTCKADHANTRALFQYDELLIMVFYWKILVCTLMRYVE